MGKRLYEALGFVLDGSFIVQVEGEEKKLEIWALTRKTSGLAGETGVLMCHGQHSEKQLER
jgi:hypothetical protein